MDGDLTLELTPALWATGRVLTAAGEPTRHLSLNLTDPPPPAAALWNFFATTCNAAGEFRLLLGAQSSAEVDVRFEGRILLHTRVERWIHRRPVSIRLM